jgi:hypothetical protein
MTVKIELTLDMDGYNKLCGLGSDLQKKYYPDGMTGEHWLNKPNWLKEAIEDILHEGFYDWDKHGLMKVDKNSPEPRWRKWPGVFL